MSVLNTQPEWINISQRIFLFITSREQRTEKRLYLEARRPTNVVIAFHLLVLLQHIGYLFFTFGNTCCKYFNFLYLSGSLGCQLTGLYFGLPNSQPWKEMKVISQTWLDVTRLQQKGTTWPLIVWNNALLTFSAHRDTYTDKPWSTETYSVQFAVCRLFNIYLHPHVTVDRSPLSSNQSKEDCNEQPSVFVASC